MSVKEIYEGPRSRHHQAPQAKAVVGENYGPLEQAAAHDWLSEQEIDEIIDKLSIDPETVGV